MPTLKWIGKDRVADHPRHVPPHALRHAYGFTAEGGRTAQETGSGNMIIHGDNLAALKSLLPRFHDAVDCIYIDPPYNTGNENWVYNDNVNDPHLRRWLGEVVGKEGEDLSRHDKWLCMMWPRLVLLRQLLSPRGAIFISIDDNECAGLKLLCDELFGAACFVADVTWQRTYSPRNDSKGIVSEAEHLLVYSRRPGWQPNRLERTAAMDAKYKNPDHDVKPWTSDNAFAPGARTHQGMVYAIQHPFTGELIYPPNTNCWRYAQSDMLAIMSEWCPYHLEDIHDASRRAEVCGLGADEVREGVQAIMLSGSLQASCAQAQAVYNRGRWPRYYFTKGGRGGIRRKTYLHNVEGRVVTNLWPYSEVGHTDEAKKELKDIFGGSIPFDTPKPVRLLERVLQTATERDSIVLDSFAGSGTTAHAVLSQNRRDGGRRMFILVEMMPYAEDVTAERVRRAMAGYPSKVRKTEDIYVHKLTARDLAHGASLLEEAMRAAEAAEGRFTKIGKPKVEDGCLKVVGTVEAQGHMPGLGGAFDYYELGPALLTADGNLNEAAGEEALRRYVFFTETHLPLSAVHNTADRYLLGTVDGTAYYFYYKSGKETVLAAENFSDVVRSRAQRYVVYADACAMDEEVRGARHLVFKKIPRDIKKY